MEIKLIVDEILKAKNRSLSWLAAEMEKTFDGLKLSLVRGSIKYNDIILMSRILEVSPSCFFEQEHDAHSLKESGTIAEEEPEYGSMKRELKVCKEMIAALKDQIKDKEKIIILLSR